MKNDRPPADRPVAPPRAAPSPVDSIGKTRELLQAAPKIEAPKGGGALRGIGETFKANPVTGSASISVPLPLPPGRNERTPALSLSYDSGGGNSPYGLGWSLSLPQVQRRSDQKLPRYRDGTDTFVMSELEDLVPVGAPTVAGGVVTQRYQPRAEGGFALIERRIYLDGESTWHTLDRANVRRSYGTTATARLTDLLQPWRTFTWYLTEEWDELGNGVRYVYESGDDPGRGSAFRYLQRVHYGNVTPGTFNDGWRFEVVPDYGGHAATPGLDPTQPIPSRLDPFSRFRAGFDVRCSRLVRRFLVFSRPDAGSAASATLVSSLDLTLDENPVATTVTGLTRRGWAADGSSLALPPLTFTYTEPSVASAPALVRGAADLPERIDFSRAQWVDLDGEGLTGLLTEAGGAWWYKRNEGDGVLGGWVPLPHRPGVPLASAQLSDLDGDGRMEVLVRAPGQAGSWARTREGSWDAFQPFRQVVNIWDAPDRTRSIDVDGDGRADLLFAAPSGLLVFRSDGRNGWLAPERVAYHAREADGPVLLFANSHHSLMLADMTGDGLVDLVRVQHHRVDYWPNLGHGRFGRRLTMANAPLLDRSDRFDARRVRLADVDGAGPADLLYVGPDRVRWWANRSGNAYGAEQIVIGVSGVADPMAVSIADLRGDGTACLVWASSLLRDQLAPLRYVRLMQAGKPYLMASMDNHLGRTTTFGYTPSTAFYLADRRAGTPWATRLPFPVQCLTTVTTADAVTGWSNTTRYAYHHGTFDGVEREFRGFGRVDQWDTEATTDGDLPPVRTVTWFHTGAWWDHQTLETVYETEFFGAVLSPEHYREGLATWSPRDRREAARALRGKPLRTEIYAEDGSALAGVPYTVEAHGWWVRRVVASTEQLPGVFLCTSRTTVRHHFERDADDARVTEQRTLAVDAWGSVTRSAQIAWPRASGSAQQTTPVVIVQEATFIHDAGTTTRHLGLPWRTTSWHLTDGVPADIDASFTAATAIDWDEATPSGAWRRRIADQLFTYTTDAGAEATGGTIGSRALVYQTYQRCFTPTQAAGLAGPGAPAMTAGGYVERAEVAGWWARSGTQTRDAAHFYVPSTFTDPFGSTTTVTWHASYLVPASVTDPLGNITSATYDARTLQPTELTDPNGDRTAVAYDALGRPVAMALTGQAGGTDGDTLVSPTMTFSYDTDNLPASSRVYARETHGVSVESTRWIETIAYSDGGGNVVMQKATAAPNGAPRWVGTGRVVLNNKGMPIRQYEPFFSATDAFEAEEGFSGVTPLITYDPLGRAVRVDLPDGNARTVAFGPWEQTTWDENDQPGKPHEGTPTTVRLDAQGRPYETVERLGATELTTTVTLDVAGNATLVTDPRAVDVQAQTFDLLGRPITTTSPDSGDDTALLDVDGQPRMVWRSGDLGVEATYDALRRRIATWEWDTDAETRVQRDAFVYGEGETDPEDDHQRGRLVRVFDPAGSLAFTYDFKGNVTSTTRRFFDDDEADVDWSTADPEVVLESDTFSVIDTFDAMNRRVLRTAPDGAVTAYTYDDGGRLIGVAVGSDDFVEEILYNARGQRTSITYGNGVGTTYTYDAATFRLTRLHTLRGSEPLQDLGYTYDPVGNILAITNDAEDTLYFDNAAVTPDQEFEYDALYRLTNAWGREKTARGWADWVEPAYGPVPSAEVMQGYEQRYEYDVGGNIKKMRHLLGGTTEWVRDYAYPTTSNRLTSTTESGGTVNYAHDVRGSIVFWPHLYQDGASSPNVVPDFRDQMRRASLNANDYAVYAHDRAGQRARKVVKKGQNVEERRYVAGWEVWRKVVSGTLDEERTTLHVMDGERRIAMVETKTVDGGSVVGSPVPRVRYQLDNHLGTSILELTEAGGIISYEEYHPYGTCAWWSGDASVDVSRRRYRYTGMERDEETGLAVHGVRYYATWLGRWGSRDPTGMLGGVNLFAYAGSNPIFMHDPTGKKPNDNPMSAPTEGAEFAPGEHHWEAFTPDGIPVVLAGGMTDGGGPPADSGRVLVYVIQGGSRGDDAVANLDGLRGTRHEQLATRLVSVTPQTLLGRSIEPGSRDRSAANAAQAIQSEYRQGDALIIYGYSAGGDVALRLSRNLADMHVPVDLLIVADAAFGPLSAGIDRTVPPNVRRAVGYYQTNWWQSSMFSSGAPLAAADESATQLENLDLTQVGVVDPDRVETVGGLANPSGIATDPRDHRYPRVVTHDYLPLIVTDAVLFEIAWTLDQDHGR